MKTNRVIWLPLAVAVTVSSAALFVSCQKEKNLSNEGPVRETYSISGNASGAQQVPSVTTGGSGTITGTYNAASNVLEYDIAWSGLSGDASAVSFHGPAENGVNADAILPVPITLNGTSGTARDSVQVSDAVETALLEGKLYYNLQTLVYPSGEIRGKVRIDQN